MCAKNDADFPVAAQACGNSAIYSGKICILPTGEHSVFSYKQAQWWGDHAYFWGYLEPMTADFAGRTVRERRLSINDPRYRSDKPGSVSYSANRDFLNKSTWTIVSRNRYGAPDRIGGGSLFPTLSPRDDCGVVAEQAMEILCDDRS